MRATAATGCEACSMILACTSHWYRGNKDTDDLRLGEGLVVHGDYLGDGVRIHALLGDSQTTPALLTPWTIVRAAGLPLEHPSLDDYVALIQGMFHKCQPYIALSHCWGHNPIPTQTLQTNKSTRLQNIPWAELTQTFQDVITLSRRLGIFFVWIDSLCIVQDDTKDWAYEASQMASIYQHAYLTVAATAATNGSVGLFSGCRQAIHSYKGTTAVTKAPFTVYARPVLDHTPFRRPDINGGRGGRLPLLTRGWCFQEQLLCPRVVHFTAEELVWDCFAGTHCECAQNDGYDMKRQLGLSIGDMSNERSNERSEDQKNNQERYKRLHGQLSKAWSDAIEQYTYRSLTFVEDRLPALSGLAAFYAQLATGNRNAIGSLGEPSSTSNSSSSFSSSTPSTSVLGKYLAGLWEKDLPFSLLWVSKYGEGQRPRQSASSSSSSSTSPSSSDKPISCPPTWSWASVENRIISFQRWSPPTAPGMEARTQVLDTVIFPSTSDPRGIVSGGRLTLRGPVARLRLQQLLIRPPSSGNYEYMQYILSYDDVASGSLFQKSTAPQTTSDRRALSKEVESPKTVAALQADVPLDPRLDIVWFLNLTEALPSVQGRKHVISGIYLQHTTRAESTAVGVPQSDAPLFERVGVGAMLDDTFQEHSTIETVTIE
ncbi:hypothetical protein SBRCBS47491_003662 [Sporothrix bragantina]|uniref:Heterokaryon incompatibility domain-containing protein n=1 Tax=Sporothrix bragantina TaxID=671064 RepID=A0ABP0BIF0_9PEZI